MKEQVEYSVYESRALYLQNLKQQVRFACARARLVTDIDPKTGLYREFLDEALAARPRLSKDKLLIVNFEDHPYSVFVENHHMYVTLVNLSMRQLLKTNHNLSDRELDTKKYQEYYADWYAKNLNHHTEHEQGHLFGASEYTTLQCRLGVEFFKTMEDVYNFRPFIDFCGIVDTDIYVKYVLNGSKQLSGADRIVANV